MVFVMIPKDESWAENLNRLKDFYVKDIVPRLVSGGNKLKSCVFCEAKFIFFFGGYVY